VLRSSNVQKGVLVFDDNVYVNSDKYNPVFENDILICVRNGSKNLIGKNALITKEAEGVAFGAFMTVFRSDLNRFVFQLLATNSYFRIIYQNLGATINSINGSDLKKFIFFFPKEKQEQQKLVNFLTAIDNHIQTLVKKKRGLEQYKKGVMQKIFKQKLRFKDDTSTSLSACDGKEFADWEKRRFSDVLFEHKLKSTGKEKVHSVSVHKGVINQIEHLGRSFSAKNTDHYSRALPNDIIYTKSPTGDFPLGIIKQNHIKKDVIISPLYGVFTPETKELGYILHVYFESPINTSNYLSSIIQKGAKNTINITNNTFLSKKMLLPVSKEEQTKIANFLSAIDKNIELVTKKIEHTKTYKKGLLQQMFV
jgi:type I restriction enzyme S subunit